MLSNSDTSGSTNFPFLCPLNQHYNSMNTDCNDNPYYAGTTAPAYVLIIADTIRFI